MKSRLNPAPLTTEDLAIMGLCAACSTSRTNEYCYCSRFYKSDRRDADLMFDAQRCRRAYGRLDGRPMIWLSCDGIGTTVDALPRLP